MRSLGDRIKRYESVTRYSATRRMPLMIRVDGRAFHTFSKGFKRPFDSSIMDAMVYSAKRVAEDMQGFKAAYIQSDEASFCITDYDSIDSEGWFDYNLSKVISISASLMTVNFNKYLQTDLNPVFDSRAFSIPVDDVINAFLWRAKDWNRNSIQMYARSFFSHKELNGKKTGDIHEMLHSIGKNWTLDLTARERNGTYLIVGDEGIDTRHDIVPSYESIRSMMCDISGKGGSCGV